jgi:sec-independent protein translocase protein TatC
VYELRRRLFYVVVCILVGSIVAYALEKQLIAVLLRPSHGQHFIYTSPLGGINFIFSVCMYVGVAASIPIIVYHLLRFLQPLMRDTTARFIFIGSAVSGIVALGGIAFGYFIGLPAALHFLLHQFTNTTQIQALLSIQSYLSFVIAYMFGSALMFQLPLIMIFINRIKPLKPSKLFHYERFIIVFAFIAGFIMNPSPNLVDQMFVVVPIILMYQVGIGMIWYINKPRRHTVNTLLEHDAESQARRAELARQLKPVVPMAARRPSVTPIATSSLPVVTPPVHVTQTQKPLVQSGRVRPRSYVNDFVSHRPPANHLVRQELSSS